MNKRKIIITALVLAAVALMAAFQLRDDRSAVVPAPDTHLVDVKNQSIDLASFKGKVVFINNWASWCPPCIAEMPSIQTLKEKLDSPDIEFVMVSFDEKRDKATRFMEKRGFDFKVYFPGKSYPYFTSAIPATFILDKQGKVVFKHEGMADYSGDEIVAKLKALANNP
jgi:thiol-disulfide isomerase/thioredoxin